MGACLQKRIWITWESQRRSIELAKKLGCELFIIEYKGILRYPKSIFRTINILKRIRLDTVFVQNPSMILTTIACIYGYLVGIPVVVDRHTTFLLNKKSTNTPKFIIFKLLHRLTIRLADLTIVTNDFLGALVKRLKGKPFVLPDKIPDLTKTQEIELKGKYNILFISSFGDDEPIREVLAAIQDFEARNVFLYITGNYKKLDSMTLRSAPSNVVFTGFIEEQEFANMLFCADAIMVLTTADHCMLCGCHEAVSVCRPLITSDKEVLREHFKEAVFVDNTIKGISDGVNQVLENMEMYRKKMSHLKDSLTAQWDERYTDLESQLSKVAAPE